jgi:ring-1,2-phenylacetyl-CoA epoxidase subunit PaaE
MSALHFYSLPIVKRVQDTPDAIVITFAVPPPLRDTFNFKAGQYLNLRCLIDGRDERRSYSICSDPIEFETFGQISVAIKRVQGGVFSEYAHLNFKVNLNLEVMPPQGRFILHVEPSEAPQHYLLFAAGSGITPIMSIMQMGLRTNPNAHFTLIYGNKGAQHIMFLEQLQGLKNRYLERVRLVHILSAQPQEMELFNGRLSAKKTQLLLAALMQGTPIKQALICGPDSMIDEVTDGLISSQKVLEPSIHAERFGAPGPKRNTPIVAPNVDQPCAKLKVQLDGKIRELSLPFSGPKLLDVALAAGMDLPYACKGGVCCTCRARVISGEVKMEKNYTLEAWEIAKGFVLTCQCSPISDDVMVSFDER